LKLVRKVSRKRYFNKRLYEYERFMGPIPSEFREAVKPWLERDMRLSVEPLSFGFAILVNALDGQSDDWVTTQRFRKTIRGLDSRKSP
jgi:hypothetical protein